MQYKCSFIITHQWEMEIVSQPSPFSPKGISSSISTSPFRLILRPMESLPILFSIHSVYAYIVSPRNPPAHFGCLTDKCIAAPIGICILSAIALASSENVLLRIPPVLRPTCLSGKKPFFRVNTS